MLFGAFFSNDQQAAAVGTFAGLALAALGGCMVPLEIFPDTMQTVARATPHAWALEALDELIVDNGGVGQILAPLGVLAAFAAVLLALAATRLYRAMVS
jgi:ABC-2 type transport system permease protein